MSCGSPNWPQTGQEKGPLTRSWITQGMKQGTGLLEWGGEADSARCSPGLCPKGITFAPWCPLLTPSLFLMSSFHSFFIIYELYKNYKVFQACKKEKIQKVTYMCPPHKFLKYYILPRLLQASQVALVVKNLPVNAGQRPGFNPWLQSMRLQRVRNDWRDLSRAMAGQMFFLFKRKKISLYPWRGIWRGVGRPFLPTLLRLYINVRGVFLLLSLLLLFLGLSQHKFLTILYLLI